MNAVQRFLSVVTNSFSKEEGPQTTSREMAAIPFKVKRRLGPNDRIVYLEESNSFDVGLCKIRLDKMFQQQWFDVCVVRDCASLLKVSLFNTSHTMDRLRVIHCVHWDQMPVELREMIPEMISEVFTEGAYTHLADQVISDQ